MSEHSNLRCYFLKKKLEFDGGIKCKKCQVMNLLMKLSIVMKIVVENFHFMQYCIRFFVSLEMNILS